MAELSGDVDRYVAVLAEHLDSAVQYEQIVLALRDGGRCGEAVDWARRALADKPGWPHADRLRDTLVDLLLSGGRFDTAVQIRRDEFVRHPTAAAWRALTGTAATAGADDPTPWALPILADRATRQPAYAGELVDVLLALGRDDDAWQAGLAHRAALGAQQWLRLLHSRQRHHPADVIAPYQDLIDQHVLDSRDKHRYRRAVDLLPSLREAYTATGDPAGYPVYLADLGTRHARRPTFLKILDAATR